MFGYARLVPVLSLLVVIALTIAGGLYLRQRAADNLTRLVEENSVSLAHGYANGVWSRYREAILPLLSNPALLKDSPHVPLFAQEAARYFERMPLVKVNIYSPDGRLLLSSDAGGAKKWAGAGSPDGAFAAAPRPAPASQVLKGVTLQSQDRATLVQTVIPLGGAAREGAVEILFDVTRQWEDLAAFQKIATGVVVMSFLVFLGISTLSARKAEQIIAKQYEANMELTAAAEAAQAENRDKSQFLANISHELRTPLNAIIGFSDVLKKEMMPQVENKKHHDYVNDIHSSGVHLLSLINDVLDYSKAEAGKLAVEVSEVNTTKMIQNSMRLVSPRAESANVALLEQLPKNPIVMMTDGKKFRQVLLNLLSNAVKFTPAGGQVTVTAWHNMADDSYSFEVEDTGIGIAPKDISRAMSPFGQVDNTLKRKYEGTGLGLPLTKKFVELMGGKFKIESELNKGTKITFTLPREVKEREGVVVKQAT